MANNNNTIKILEKIKEELEKLTKWSDKNDLSNDQMSKNRAVQIAIEVIAKIDLGNA